ncbi:HNH endonuclease signature motif containing protein [Arthrobacter pityocampae]|uniref:HNH endonuclease signature motif containing protein n=1 Tax=Arthrobacter pityocampae TaxID=547334 RepID=UPI0011B063F3|nr:HNH endonuclease signature motif containing protein [Arthrobacter pityocampae]
MATAVAEEQSTTAQALSLVRSHLVYIAGQFEADAGLASTADLAEALGVIEHLAREVEYLQVVGAAAADQQEIARVGETRQGLGWSGPLAVPSDSHEFRDTAEYLRARLGITRHEAQRRIRLGKSALPRRTVTGELCPALLESVGDAFKAGAISSYAATRISDAVDRVRPCASTEQVQAMEENLVAQATESDADLVNVVIRRWEAALDPDGADPTEALLKAQQGVFIRGRRRGLHRLEIAADDEQFEYLLTVMNTATNPRTRRDVGSAGVTSGGGATGVSAGSTGGSSDPGERLPWEVAQGGAPTGGFEADTSLPDTSMTGDALSPDVLPPDAGSRGSVSGWERRTRAQRHLDGVVGACQVALATDTLPATGGHRPQVMVTIDYRTLLEDLRNGGVLRRRIRGLYGQASESGRNGYFPGDGHIDQDQHAEQDHHTEQDGHFWRNESSAQDKHPGWDGLSRRRSHFEPDTRPMNDTGSDALIDPSDGSDPHPAGGYSIFGGPVSVRTVRKIACDADIIPVVLGGRGEVLDVGRARRLFGVAQRRALVARDRGCAFPDCTVPAVWSEAHHITPWLAGGRTDVSNGCLLCSFHHRLVERGNWIIQVKHGVPWFTPPPYIDPDRTPRRNKHRELVPGGTS